MVESPGPISWTDANDDTIQKQNQYGVHGHLVTITAEWEMSLVGAMLKINSKGSKYGCWMGLRKIAGKDNFEWVNGETVTYLNWDPTLPSISDDEQYALVSCSL